jgi:GTP pyrophosphokinase
MSFVKTSIAKERIRNWFKKQNRSSNLEAGRKIIEEDLKELGKGPLDKLPKEKINKLTSEFNYKDLESLLVAVGDGSIPSSRLIKKLFSEEFLIKKPESKISKIPFIGRVFKKPPIQIAGSTGLKFKLASCCNPIIGQPIVGFVTRGKGITVHKKSCSNIKKLDKKQLVDVSWGESAGIYEIPIKISAIDRIGLFKDIAGMASSLGINLVSVSTSAPKNKEVTIDAILEVNDVSQVMVFFRKAKEVKNILEVKRKP